MAEPQFEDLQSATSAAARPPATPGKRLQRSESRRTNTYSNFMKELTKISAMSMEEAEQAASSVICALEQRLTGDEVFDFESQLPAKLRDLLVRCEHHEGDPPRKFGLEDFYGMVAADLEKTVDETKPVVRDVFLALHAQISQGEADDVASQLPKEMAAIWNNP